jgi:hypothetical protein
MTKNRCLDGRAVFALVFALLVCACATNLQITDTSGRKVNLDTPHLAEQHLSGGRVVVYANTPDDIDRLIRELHQLGVTDRQLLNPEGWSKNPCPMGKNPPCPVYCSKLSQNRCTLAGFATIKWCACLPVQ